MGAFLDKPLTEYIDAEAGEANGLSWGVSSMQGWRTEMEDQHVVSVGFLPGHTLFAVFDGHGGRNAALFSAAELVGTITSAKAFAPYAEDQADVGVLVKALKEGFLALDAKMRQTFDNAQAYPNERSGCTAICVVVTPTHVVTANAGDSRAVLCRAGASVPLSFDHKPWLPEELRRIEAATGFVAMKRVDGELAVSRALGDFQFKDAGRAPEATKVTSLPDVSVHARDDRDQFLVLACDGIWDVMSNEDVIDAVTGYASGLGEGSPRLMAEELMENCLSRNSRDNMTACVVLFDEAGGRALVAPGGAGVTALRLKRLEAARGVPASGGGSGDEGM